jgi:hypothetical protein
MADKQSPRLSDYATTDRQRQVIDAVERLGGVRQASRELKVEPATIREHMRIVTNRAAIRGWAPEHDMTKTTADPYAVKGTSTLYGPDGVPIIQWVKTSIEHEKLLAIMREAVNEMKQDVKPIRPIKLVTKKNDADLLNLYTLSDAHIGMLAWHEDGGADWDIKIAEKSIIDAFVHLVSCSPDAKHGFFAQLGDGLHSDGMIPVTPAHGHVLDQDGRFHKVVRTAIRIFRTVITMLLEKHQQVTVLMAQGNHDPASSVWLQEMFAVLYEKNPRVNIIVSPKPYYAQQHGDVMLGFHHGHKATPQKLPDVFMGEFREMYGRTKQTYIHCGHRHSVQVVEFNSAVVEQHRTITARDAHASHSGYKSGRSMNVTTYHKTRLKYSECVYNP